MNARMPLSRDIPLPPERARLRSYTAPLNVKPPRRRAPSPPTPSPTSTVPDIGWPLERTHVPLIRRPSEAGARPVPDTFYTAHRKRYRRNRALDLEAGPTQGDAATTAAKPPRILPLIGQLPDNWQLGVAIGTAVGLFIQLTQIGVNSKVLAAVSSSSNSTAA